MHSFNIQIFLFSSGSEFKDLMPMSLVRHDYMAADDSSAWNPTQVINTFRKNYFSAPKIQNNFCCTN